MATHPLSAQGTRGVGERTAVQASALRWSYQASLGTVGAFITLMALWGGIVPFVGASFGLSPDGLGNFHWDLARGILAVVPAGAALVAGLSLMQLGRVAGLGVGRLGVLTAGVLAVVAGCWFAIGPAAWPVLEGHHYLAAAGAYSSFERELAYVLGPGLFLVVMGGLACEFAILQRGAVRELAVEVLPSETPIVDTRPLPGDVVEHGAEPATGTADPSVVDY